MKKNTSPVSDFFKKVWLLLRCIFTSLSFVGLWAGIALLESSLGIYIIIISAILLILCIYTNIILPIMRIPLKKR